MTVAGLFFQDKVVLLTGASQGIGAGLARRLSMQGALLVVTSRDLGDLRTMIAGLPFPERATPIPADLSVPGEVKRLTREASGVDGGIDVLINNAGVGYYALAEEAREEKLRQLFEVNTFSPFLLAQALLPGLKERGGRIVNVVSCAGRVPIPTVAVYGGSKSALAMLMNIMRLEIEPSGVDVINVYPGTVDTGFEENAPRERNRVGLCPGGGCGSPVDVIVDRIMSAAAGPAGEVWLEEDGRTMAARAILAPGEVDEKMTPLRDRVLKTGKASKPHEERLWRLWQIETSFACNLSCVMCPWREMRRDMKKEDGLMSEEVWEALGPHLTEVAEVDFSGGGEPLTHPRLAERIAQAKAAGCRTGFLTNGTLLDEHAMNRILAADVDWICFSADGSNAGTFERIRRGSSFDEFCENVRRLTDSRRGVVPRVLFNFVMMPENVDELGGIVELAARLGVDQVNFKQCDVIRGDQGKDRGLFGRKKDREIKKYEKELGKARKLAKKLDIETTAFSFTPEELAVCSQDPRTSIFVSCDGRVSPCISLAIGGPTTFLGDDVTMPSVHYGRLPEQDLLDIWKSDTCRFYRERFEERVSGYNIALSGAPFETSLSKLRESLENAKESMPPAPEGCRICHYLYDI